MTCVLQLSGPVDECCCDVETVDSLNEHKVFPLISSLVQKTYFRFFQVSSAQLASNTTLSQLN